MLRSFYGHGGDLRPAHGGTGACAAKRFVPRAQNLDAGAIHLPRADIKIGVPAGLGPVGLTPWPSSPRPWRNKKVHQTGALLWALRFFVVIWQCPSGDVTKYFVDRLPPDHRSWGWGGPFFPWATRCCGMKISFFTERKTVYFFRKALTFYQNACMITTVTICNLFVSGCYRSDTDRIQTD